MNVQKSLLIGIAALCAAVSVHAADVTGMSSGTFVNPLPTGNVVTGVGTSHFTFGLGQNSPPSSLTFSQTSFNANFGTPFKLGNLSYFNGTIAANTDPDTVDLRSLLHFSTPSIPDVISTITFTLNSTPNTGTPDQNADFVNFSNSTSLSSFLIGGILYNVAVTGFQNVTGDGFLASNSSEFHVREGGTASADLYGSVSRAAVVPEPGTVALLGLGLLGFAASQRKFRKNI